MMIWLDHFVDTRAKRSCCIAMLTLILMIMMLVSYLCLGITLASLQEYHDVFGLLQRTQLTWTYLSRIIVTLVGTASIDGMDIVYALIHSLRFWEVITICLAIQLVHFRIVSIKKECKLMKYLLLVCMVASFCVLLYGFQAMTLQRVVYALKILGYVLVCFSISCSMFCLYIMRLILPAYREALTYYVEELEKE